MPKTDTPTVKNRPESAVCPANRDTCSVRVTLDRYSHVTVDMQDTAAEATDTLLAPLLRPKAVLY